MLLKLQCITVNMIVLKKIIHLVCKRKVVLTLKTNKLKMLDENI